ncbi:MAG: DUF3570 domain-containing protein, partial [Nannocystaceae bacterium]
MSDSRPRVRVARAASIASLATLLVATLAACWWPSTVDAEDRVLIRGNYYRERSTRVLQPYISFSKDLPDERLTIGADYLMDVISSASIGAAALQLGGDKVFTEMRHEATIRVASRLQDWSVGSFFRYSTETDYESKTVGLSLARELRQKTITLGANYAYTFDRAFRILANIPGTRIPWKSKVPTPEDPTEFVDGPSNLLQVHNLSLGYNQVLTRTLLASLQLEGSLGRGPQENPYRRVRNGMEEVHPLLRRRVAVSGSARYAIPKARLVLEPRYRFSADDWAIRSHAPQFRVHLRAIPTLSLRARYRYYTQTASDFWVASGDYPATARYRTADPKMGAFDSHT